MENLIAIVDRDDVVIDFRSKHIVHTEGVLHRAFSIFIFNARSELLIHQRAFEKYHSPGEWTNTCCSHLPTGMNMEQAIHTRLLEEMGFDTELKYVGKFHYCIKFENGLTENEIDHIYIGFFSNEPKPNASEVASYRWISLDALAQDIAANPARYTYWLKHIMFNHRGIIEMELNNKGLEI